MADADYRVYARDRRFAGLAHTAKRSTPHLTRRGRRDLVAELSIFPALAGAGERELVTLIERSVRFSLPPNWVMVREGTPATSCYLITAGSARLLQGRYPVGEVGRGDIVGDLTLMTHALRPTTVTTTTRVSGIRVTNTVLTELGARP